MKISIFGLGYVGAVSLACLARDGHSVIGVDIDPAKLELIRTGKTPVVEEGMVDLMASVAGTGRVAVTTDAEEAVLASDLSLISVGTPSAPNGSQDQTAVQNLAAELGRALAKKQRPGHVFVFRSTLVPGTVEDVLAPIIERESGTREGDHFHVAFQPEFLREGSSIRDYDNPPFVIVGARDAAPLAAVRELFGHLRCEFHETSVRAAEMVKYCCNNFHALKITFANETARLCEALDVDPFAVMDLVCKDRQLNISPAYLRPGFAFGGSCLPKDLRATLHMARRHDVDLPLHASLLQSNRAHIDHAINKVLASGKRRVGMIGLSFKTGTDDLRESPLVALAEHFIGKGLEIEVWDPEVHLSRLLGANRRFIETHVPHIARVLKADVESVVRDADLLVVGLRDERAFAAIEAHCRPGQVVLDLVRMPRGEALRGDYVGLCW
jgi:GDP-mannose 6-dehydrogenase